MHFSAYIATRKSIPAYNQAEGLHAVFQSEEKHVNVIKSVLLLSGLLSLIILVCLLTLRRFAQNSILQLENNEHLLLR